MKRTILTNAVPIFFVIGILLLALNIYGAFKTLRSPLTQYQYLFSNETSDMITMSKDEVFQKLSQKNLTDEEYVKIATDAIHQGILHYWDDELGDKFNLRVPIYENYFLYTASYLYPSIYKKYEFCSLWRKGIERGVGFCSQSSAILVQALREKGIDSQIYVMYGHVITRFMIDKEKNVWQTADPDYGVVIPYDIYEIQDNPEIIRAYYEKVGKGATEIDYLVTVYDKNTDIKRGFIRHTNYCTIYHRVLEYVLYILKWLLPLIFITPQMFFLMKIIITKNNKRTNK